MHCDFNYSTILLIHFAWYSISWGINVSLHVALPVCDFLLLFILFIVQLGQSGQQERSISSLFIAHILFSPDQVESLSFMHYHQLFHLPSELGSHDKYRVFTLRESRAFFCLSTTFFVISMPVYYSYHANFLEFLISVPYSSCFSPTALPHMWVIYHCAKKPVTTMLTYPWKCTVFHCNHLGNTWKPLVLMT